MAVASVALFFLSLTLHELGHALGRAAQRNRDRRASTCGSSAASRSSAATATRRARSSASARRGRSVTLLIVVAGLRGRASWPAAATTSLDALGHCATTRAPRWRVLGWLALVNAGLFVFNLIPAYPLDGGRIARAIAWKVTGDRNRGTRFSARLGPGASPIVLIGGWASGSRSSVATPAAASGSCSSGWFLGQAATRRGRRRRRFPSSLEGVTRRPTSWTPSPVWRARATLPAAAGAGRVLPALPLAVVPGRRPGLGALPRRCCARRPRRRRRRGRASRRSSSPTCSMRRRRGLPRRTTTPPIEQLLGSEGLRSLGALMVVDGDDRAARRRHARAGPPRARGRGAGPRRLRIAAPPGAGLRSRMVAKAHEGGLLMRAAVSAPAAHRRSCVLPWSPWRACTRGRRGSAPPSVTSGSRPWGLCAFDRAVVVELQCASACAERVARGVARRCVRREIEQGPVRPS